MIKKNGGIFGRNPTYNDVVVEGTLTMKEAQVFDNDITINGDLTVNGTETVINTVELNVDDKNITMGAVVAKVGLMSTTNITAGQFTVQLAETSGLIPGMTVTKTAGTGAFGASPKIASVDSHTQITLTVAHATSGSIIFDTGGATDDTADGGGITLKGTTDKFIKWVKASVAWVFSDPIKAPDVTVDNLTASKPVFTDANKKLTSTGTLAIDQGGTGQTTANAALNALLPSQTSASGKYLKSDGTNSAWDQIDINSSDVTGTLPIASGGTGQTTRQAALNGLAGAVTAAQFLRGDGTNVSMSAIQASDVPTLNQNTTGTAAGLSATLAINKGGTNNTAFTAKSGNVAGLVFFDGASLVNDATVTDVGYDTSTHTLYGKHVNIPSASGEVSLTQYQTQTWNLTTNIFETAKYQRFKLSVASNCAGLIKIRTTTEPRYGIGWSNVTEAWYKVQRTTGGTVYCTMLSVMTSGSGGKLCSPVVSGSDVIFGLEGSNNGTGTEMFVDVTIDTFSRYSVGWFVWSEITGTTAHSGTAYADTTQIGANDFKVVDGDLVLGTANKGVSFTSGGRLESNRGQVAAAGSSTTTLFTLGNVSENRSYLLSVRQSGSSTNQVVAQILSYGAGCSALRIAQDNTPGGVLDMNITVSGLNVRLVIGSGFGTTTWDWVLTRLG